MYMSIFRNMREWECLTGKKYPQSYIVPVYRPTFIYSTDNYRYR